MSQRLHTFVTILCLMCLSATISSTAYAQECDSRDWYDEIIQQFSSNGIDGTVYASLVDAHGNLWVAGNFTSAESTLASNIAYFDGTAWRSPGKFNAPVYALVEYNGEVVAAGGFTSVDGVTLNFVASWNGDNWGPFGGGVNDTTRALHVYGGKLYVGGDFSTAGSIGATRIAAWDGSQWAAVGAGIEGASVQCMAEYNGSLFVGGTFSLAGGTASQSIASWNGATWSALDEGVTSGGTVYTLLPHESGLFIGGAFTHINNLDGTQNIAKWSSNVWSGLTDQSGSTTAITSVTGTVRSLGVTQDGSGVLSIGGDIVAEGGIEQPQYVVEYLFNIPQPMFQAPSHAFNGPVYEQSAYMTHRLFGGSFEHDGSTVVASLAVESTTGSWSSVSGRSNNAILGVVTDIVASGDNSFVVVGDFDVAGDRIASNIAMNVDGDWAAFPGEFNGRINSVAAIGSSLLVGGEFTQIDELNTNYVAYYDGNWNSLEDGANAAVFAVAGTSPSNMYCGGDFTQIGSTSANRIASWDGSQWKAMASGMNARVNVIEIAPDNDQYVLAGGAFTPASGLSSHSIAYWTSDRWRSIGSGVEGIVYDLSFIGEGIFLMAGEFIDQELGAQNFAAGSMQSLSMVGGYEVQGIVFAVSAIGDQSIGMAGDVEFVGDCEVSGIGLLDSTAAAFGSGTNGRVNTMARMGDGWLVGGEFSAAGSAPSGRLAWIPECDVNMFLEGETQLCPGTATTLFVEEDFSHPLDGATFEWSTGSTGSSITVDTPGSYSVTVVWPGGCQQMRTAEVTMSDVVTTAVINLTDLSNTFEYCSGASIELGVIGFESVEWSNGMTDDVIEVSEPGEYWATAVDDRGCQVISDTITVVERPLPDLPVIEVEFLTAGGDWLNEAFRCDVCENYEQVQWFVDGKEVEIENLLELVYAGELELFVEYEVYVVITNEYGCSMTSEVVVQALTDVIDAQHGIVLAPHPARDHVVIQGLNAAPKSLVVTSMSGQKVSAPWTTHGTDIQVQTSSLPAGTYSLVIEAAGKTHLFTFVKL